MNVDLDSLINHLDYEVRTVLEGSSGKCVARGGYEITIEDFLLELLELPGNEFSEILKQFDVPVEKINRAILRAQDLRTGNTSNPVFSPLLINWLQESWLLCSLKLKSNQITAGVMILTLLSNPNRFGRMPYFNLFENISLEKLFILLEGQINANELYTDSPATNNSQLGNALEKYTIDFTALADNGDIDPVLCRDTEIRQIIDILARRRKNNPITVGEPGVGKTAIVEGLALKIVQDEVPDILINVRLLGLDMGLLQAGASVKGEFEKRLKAVIDEVKCSEQSIILFVDEAHTLVGSGGQAGGNDAANLLKPALARGELRTIAATTWSEYKKYFEKDPALARRFQLVKLDEPTVEQAISILRGLKDKYESNHGVYIRDDAIESAARLSKRYISGRLLPDKAIDVLDTACARVKISISSQPKTLDDYAARKKTLERQLTAISRDIEMGLKNNVDTVNRIQEDLLTLSELYQNSKCQWQKESKISNEIIRIRQMIIKNICSRVDEHQNADLLMQLESLMQQLKNLINNSEYTESALVSYEVDADLVAKVVSEWTGIPMTRMANDDSNEYHSFRLKMLQRIKGQEHAVNILDNSVKTTKAGLSNPDSPNGVFLLVGPSGVGKTETALAMADLLYGGERFMTIINMSEFQEKHSVSRLIGSPPGYVGYGEGGLLTEAIRKRPYSVVLLDEVEKADPEVMNLFYQVFDKGILNDSEGREIDFKNTIILLTSNIGADIIIDQCQQEETIDSQSIIASIRHILSQYFKPALLSRMTIVPYFPVHGQVMTELTQLKLERVASRVHQEYNIKLQYDDNVLQQIALRCNQIETGARNIDHIINHNIIPQISSCLLDLVGQEVEFDSLIINVNNVGKFNYQFV